MIEDNIDSRYSRQADELTAVEIPREVRSSLIREKEKIRLSPVFLAERVQDYIDSQDQELIDPITAQEEYGIQITTPRSKSSLQREYSRKRKGEIIDGLLQQAQSQQGGIGNTLQDLGAAITIGALDPVNYIPASRLLRLSKLSRVANMGIFQREALTGVVDGAIGNLLSTPFAAYQYKKHGMEYGFEDAMFEVATGGFIGGGFGSASGIIGSKTFRGMLRDARGRKNLARQYKAIQTQIKPDAREHLDNLYSIAEREGRGFTEEEAISIARVWDEETAYKQGNNDNIYTGETLLRSDPTLLTVDEKALLLREASKNNFFNKKATTLDEIFTTTQKLSKELQFLKDTLKTRDGTITLKDLVADSGVKYNTLANALDKYGLKAQGKTVLNAEQAFEINKLIRGLAEEQAVTLDEVVTLQQKLLNTKSLSDLPFNEFQKKIDSLIDEFKDSDINVRNLDKLDVDKQGRALEFLRVLNEANLTTEQLDDLFTKTELGFRDLYDNIQLNKTIKDTIPLDRAVENVQKIARNEVKEIPEPNLLGEEFDLKVEDGVSEAYLTERTEILSRKLPQETLDSFKVDEVDVVDRSLKLADAAEVLFKECR